MQQTINEIEQEIIESFDIFDNWLDKYQYIIDLGKKLKDLPIEAKIDANLIKGCQSKVWLTAEIVNNTVCMQAISDSSIVSGLIYILLAIYNNRTGQEILENKAEFIQAIGLEQHLSLSRNNGLTALLKEIKRLAAIAAQNTTMV